MIWSRELSQIAGQLPWGEMSWKTYREGSGAALGEDYLSV